MEASAKLLVLSAFLGALVSSAVRARDISEDLTKLSLANNEFALKLHRRLAEGDADENVVFSPFSISTALSMIYLGARGDTAEELRQGLGFDAVGLSDEEVHSTYKRFVSDVLLRNDSNGYRIRNANALLFNASVHLDQNYFKRVRDFYGALIRSVNFNRDQYIVIDEMNRWVRDKTEGEIDSLVVDLPLNTLSVILNAIYFKGVWKTKFNSEYTSPEVFYNNGDDSQAKEVDMMYVEGRFPLASETDCTVLELPYMGDDISMLILLPDERDGLPALENSLSTRDLARIRQNLNLLDHALRVRLPRFKIEFSKNLAEDLSILNITSIFGSEADLSGMVDVPGFSVSDVLHKAVIETNEEGSTAAGGTAIAVGRNSLSFFADHPFLFMIVSKRNDLILFMGRVNNL